MVTRDEVFSRLRRKARNFGGNIRKVSDAEFRSLGPMSAPFTGWSIGIRIKAREVIFTSWCEPYDLEQFATGLTHEMGHLFATKQYPNKCEEFDFLGWEMLLARKIGITDKQFCQGHADYVVDDTWGEAYELRDFLDQPRARSKFFAKRINASKELGLIRHGHPCCIRGN